MVETAEADVICGTVAGDDPLRTVGDVLLDGEDALAYVTSASLAERYDLLGYFLGGGNVVAVVEPLLGESLDVRAALVTLESGLHVGGYAHLELLVCDAHAETKLCEVLEERVGPCHTFALGVLGVGG